MSRLFATLPLCCHCKKDVDVKVSQCAACLSVSGVSVDVSVQLKQVSGQTPAHFILL